MDINIDRVEGDRLGLVHDVEVNDNSSGVGELFEIGLQGKVIMAGYHIGREELTRGDIEPAGRVR